MLVLVMWLWYIALKLAILVLIAIMDFLKCHIIRGCLHVIRYFYGLPLTLTFIRLPV